MAWASSRSMNCLGRGAAPSQPDQRPRTLALPPCWRRRRARHGSRSLGCARALSARAAAGTDTDTGFPVTVSDAAAQATSTVAASVTAISTRAAASQKLCEPIYSRDACEPYKAFKGLYKALKGLIRLLRAL